MVIIMLKIKELNENQFKKYGFKKYQILDEIAYVKNYKLGTNYSEDLIIWIKDRTFQAQKSIFTLDTLYDLIQDGLVEKV